MKGLGWHRGKKDAHAAPLLGKVVQVGAFHVKLETVLGDGGFACVYRARDIKDGKLFAMKHLRLAGNSEASLEVQMEAKTMAKLRGHPNILYLHAVAFAGPRGAETDAFMLLDLCPQTLLGKLQSSHHHMDDLAIVEAFGDVLQGVAHMHNHNPPFAHRDLKVENVLQDQKGNWVLCDFGSASTRAQVYETTAEIAEEENTIMKKTTPTYRAPEMWDMLTRKRIDTKVDIWALGVMLYVLAFGKLPFQAEHRLAILYGRFDMPPTRSAELRALIADLLTADPDKRPDIHAVIARFAPIKAAVRAAHPSAAQPHPHPHPHPHAAHPLPHQPAPAPGYRPAQPHAHQQPLQAPPQQAPPQQQQQQQQQQAAAAAAAQAGLRRPSISIEQQQQQQQPPGSGGTTPRNQAPGMHHRPPPPVPAAAPQPGSADQNWADFSKVPAPAPAPTPAMPPSSTSLPARPVPSSAAGPSAVPNPASSAAAGPSSRPAQPAPTTSSMLPPAPGSGPIPQAPMPAMRPASASSSSGMGPADVRELQAQLARLRENTAGDSDAIRRQLKEVVIANKQLHERVRSLEDTVSQQQLMMHKLKDALDRSDARDRERDAERARAAEYHQQRAAEYHQQRAQEYQQRVAAGGADPQQQQQPHRVSATGSEPSGAGGLSRTPSAGSMGAPVGLQAGRTFSSNMWGGQPQQQQQQQPGGSGGGGGGPVPNGMPSANGVTPFASHNSNPAPEPSYPNIKY